MPSSLAKSHATLDRLYRSEPFDSDSDRAAHLLERYQALTTWSANPSPTMPGVQPFRAAPFAAPSYSSELSGLSFARRSYLQRLVPTIRFRASVANGSYSNSTGDINGLPQALKAQTL
jgi:hypothetical protein